MRAWRVRQRLCRGVRQCSAADECSFSARLSACSCAGSFFLGKLRRLVLRACSFFIRQASKVQPSELEIENMLGSGGQADVYKAGGQTSTLSITLSLYIYIYRERDIHMYIYIYICICTYIYIYMYIYTHVWLDAFRRGRLSMMSADLRCNALRGHLSLILML